MNLRAGRSRARIASRRAGRDGRKRNALLRFEAHLPQAGQKAAFDLIGVRLQQPRQSLKMNPKLVA